MLVLVAVVVLAPLAAGPVVAAVGAPIRRLFGAVGVLSNENARRNPRRTAATASALMIGLALITAVSVLAVVDQEVGRRRSSARAPGPRSSCSASGTQALPTNLTSDLAAQPGVASAAGIAIVPGPHRRQQGCGDGDQSRCAQGQHPADAPSPATSTRSGPSTHSDQQEGVRRSRLEGRHRAAASASPRAGRPQLRVAGIYKENQLAGGYLMDQATAARFVTNLTDVVSLVSAKPGANPDVLRKTIENVLAQVPGHQGAEPRRVHPERAASRSVSWST